MLAVIPIPLKAFSMSGNCALSPSIFERMLTYAYKIEFEEKPDYIYLKRLCKQELSAYE